MQKAHLSELSNVFMPDKFHGPFLPVPLTCPQD
jgi:hypothetical protein